MAATSIGTLMVDMAANVASLKTDMDRAVRVVSRGSQDMQRMANMARSALGAIGLGLSAAGLASVFRSVVGGAAEAMDAIGKLSQKVGIGVEALGELEHAAKLADVSREELQTGVTRLAAKVADAASGNKEAAETFKILGVEFRNSNGTLRATDEVLKDVAQRFSEFRDGTTKTALAVDLFGRSGANLIPLLNAGRKGLADAAAEARVFGTVFGEDAAKAAEEFNDNLTRLREAARGASYALMHELMEPLRGFSNEMVRAAKESRVMKDIAASLAFVLKGLASVAIGVGAAFSLIAEGISTTATAGWLLARGELKAAAAAVDIARKESQGTIDSAKRMIAALLDAGENPRVSFSDARYEAGRKGMEPVIPLKPDTAAIAAAKATADALEKIASARDAAAIATAKSTSQALKSVYDTYRQQGLIGEAEYWDRREQLERDAFAKEAAALDAQVSRRQALLDRATPKAGAKPTKEFYDALRELEEAQNKRNELEVQFAAQGVQTWFARIDAARQYQQALTGVSTQLKELSGDAVGAALGRFDEQYRELRQRITATSGADSQAMRDLDALREATRAQAEFSRLQERRAEVERRLSAEEERVANSQRSGAIGEFDAMLRLGELRSRAVAQLQEIAGAMNAVAQASGLPKLKTDAEEAANALESLRGSADVVGDKFRTIGESGFSTFFRSIIDGTESVSGAFKKMTAQIGAEFADLIARDLGRQLYNSIFPRGVSGGGSVFGSLLSSVFGGVGQLDSMPVLPRADGGPVDPGRPYLVGEVGPELIVPRSAGTVVPTKSLGGQTVTINQSFAFGAGTSRADGYAIVRMAAQAATAAVRDAHYRNDTAVTG